MHQLLLYNPLASNRIYTISSCLHVFSVKSFTSNRLLFSTLALLMTVKFRPSTPCTRSWQSHSICCRLACIVAAGVLALSVSSARPATAAGFCFVPKIYSAALRFSGGLAHPDAHCIGRDGAKRQRHHRRHPVITTLHSTAIAAFP
jgi:hypothetical protein